jgi:hypothetical protein
MADHVLDIHVAINRRKVHRRMLPDENPENLVRKTLAYHIHAGKIQNNFQKTIKPGNEPLCLRP